MSVKNIIVFGQTGAGKSSVINLMAGKQEAKTSNNTTRCTMHWEEYLITFSERTFKVFDTVGIEEPQLGIDEYLAVIENSYNLIAKLQKEGGIDLLLFCVRAGRYTSPIHYNYRLFYECLCEQKVPIVLIISGLEREPQNMEDWWLRCGTDFDKYGVIVNGHACITAIDGTDWKGRYEESRHLVHNLVLKHCYEDSPRVLADEGWLSRFTIKLKEVFVRVLGSKKKSQVVNVLTKRCGMPRAAALQLATKLIKT